MKPSNLPSLSPIRKLILAASVSILATGSFQSAPAQMINGAQEAGTVSQLPGLATDYDLFGTSTSSSQNFSAAPIAGENANEFGGTIITPGPSGTSVDSGSLYDTGDGTTRYMATFTLGSSSTFDYSDFDVFVLFANSNTVNSTDSTVFNDADILLAPGKATDTSGTGATTADAKIVPVNDTNTSSSMGQIVEFNITGAQSGDSFSLGATGGTPPAGSKDTGPFFGDIGGVSFSPGSAGVPEPSTVAMALLGLAVLVLILRAGRLANRD